MIILRIEEEAAAAASDDDDDANDHQVQYRRRSPSHCRPLSPRRRPPTADYVDTSSSLSHGTAAATSTATTT